MNRIFRLLVVSLVLIGPAAEAQRRRPPRHDPARPVVTVRGKLVFIGGYFYDPFFGPYPWWPRADYPYRYFPAYDDRAQLRISVKPKTTAVYVDGFYAGIVDDFDGLFQSLPVPPGGHEITLFLEGYRTLRISVYLGPGGSFKITENMARLAPGETSEKPRLAPPLPPPPAGTYRIPTTPDRNGHYVPREPAPPNASTTGWIELRVQPVRADIAIDGERWVSSDEGYLVVDLSPGPHRIAVTLAGFQSFETEIVVKEDLATPLNVSLAPKKP